ncbi:hypothetical protein F5884DRAFT_857929 [Xylogone sp. PMI_703]|nr:hypothetical protein F5884DRAFT_857929 [Xylogone sp. PMI_703]
MLKRGKSKDRSNKAPSPGPSYMSDEQFAGYLADLRNNRVARPSGARPPPVSFKRQSWNIPAARQDGEPASAGTSVDESLGRSASAMSHRRAQSALSNYSSSVSSRHGRSLVQPPTSNPDAPKKLLKPSEVVPSATYIERGQRWMEKEEAVSLRDAMEDLDLKKGMDDETRIHAAAQAEASELVWQHQHPESVIPDAPYRYTEHLRKNSYAHARTQSVGRHGGAALTTGLARDITPRSVSGGSSSSGGMHSQRSRVSSESSSNTRLLSSDPGDTTSEAADIVSNKSPSLDNRKSYGQMSNMSQQSGGSVRRRSGRRNISGEISSIFTGEQIWEEPQQISIQEEPHLVSKDAPAPLRLKPRSPLNRVQFAHDTGAVSKTTPSQSSKRHSISEIHLNPPSQSRNPAYTSNPPPNPAEQTVPEIPQRDGIEIRSDEIRQATSMRLKDRSPKLPTPTAVSDKPGRPIVSFDTNWKPKEADVKPETRRRSPFDRRPVREEKKVLSSHSSTEAVSPIVSTIPTPDPASPQVTKTPSKTVPTINLSSSTNHTPSRSVPSISLPGPEKQAASVSVPVINLPDSTNTPTINLPDTPSISISTPETPSISINVPSPSPSPSPTPSKRPLPDPKKVASRPFPRHGSSGPLSRPHWSPAVGNRATATCHQCQLPIEGRVVSLRGVAERFHPECFVCYTCGTALEALEISPEPPAKRAARLDRIQRRRKGEEIEEIEGQTMADDGDERLRFYCHLDWHENFAPRCKHCKTPIIGEHVVALGEHWHYGHFFCAECGDPFEQGMTHIEKDGYAWCLGCQTKRTERRAPKCKKCRLPVIGQYVQALGGEWHDACFRCSSCSGGFDDCQIFLKTVDGETIVLCTQCMERELKA